MYLATIACDVSTPVTWPVGANEDSVCAVILGGADGKVFSSSWQFNAQSPLGRVISCIPILT